MQEGRKHKGKDERGWERQRKICKRMGNIMRKMQVVGKNKNKDAIVWKIRL